MASIFLFCTILCTSRESSMHTCIYLQHSYCRCCCCCDFCLAEDLLHCCVLTLQQVVDSTKVIRAMRAHRHTSTRTHTHTHINSCQKAVNQCVQDSSSLGFANVDTTRLHLMTFVCLLEELNLFHFYFCPQRVNGSQPAVSLRV